jgi:hypothetical protein
LPPEQWAAYAKWKASLETNVSAVAAKQAYIANLYMQMSAALDGQDLPEILSTGTNVNLYISKATQFMTEAVKDYGKLQWYRDEIERTGREIQVINSLDEGFAKLYGVTLVDQREESASVFMAKWRESLLQTQVGQAHALNSQLLYMEAVDEKSKELLNGWDNVKDAAKKSMIIGAVEVYLDFISQTGISGNAIYRLMGDEGKKMLNRTSDTWVRAMWQAAGFRGGQALDYITTWKNIGMYLDGLNKHAITTSSKGYEVLDEKIQTLTGPNSNFQALADRLKEHLAWAKKQEESSGDGSPNPFIPV